MKHLGDDIWIACIIFSLIVMSSSGYFFVALHPAIPLPPPQSDYLRTSDPDVAARVKTCAGLLLDLRHRRASFREAAAQKLAQKHCDPRQVVPVLARLLKDPDVNVRWSVDHALLSYGPRAAPAIPALLEVFQDPQTKEWAPMVLAHIGEPAVPAMLELLQDPRPELRRSAAWTLGAIGQPAMAATAPLLERARQDQNPGVRRTATWALASIHDRLVSSLTHALADHRPSKREAALQALWELGDEACPARARIARLKRTDPSPAVREAAAKTLVNLRCY